MTGSDDGFEEIFKRLTKEDFLEDPMRILSFMPDFGFDSLQVRMLRTVMTEDMKEVKEFLQSPPGSGCEMIGSIADYCLVSEDALRSILEGIRSSLDDGIRTEIVDDEKHGRCRRSLNGIALFSLDMTVLLKVEDVESFSIPDSVTEIGRWAFSGCSSLEEVIIPDSVTEIGDYAFSGCKSLEKIVIPDSVTEIGKRAFWGSISLEKVIIPDSVTEIVDDEKHGRCRRSLNGIALFSLDMTVLLKVEDVESFSIPDSVTEIGEGAFSGCSSLEEVVIPDSVTEIGIWAFSDCCSLEKVVIPDSVTEIGEDAFWGCGSARFIVDPDNRRYYSESGKLRERRCPHDPPGPYPPRGSDRVTDP